MKLLEEIKALSFHSIGNKQVDDFEKVIEILALHIDVENLAFVKQDFDKFIEYGKFLIFNTFCGGIIFLREPEVIKNITIEFFSLPAKAIASVEYDSEVRDARNIKYKPGTGKIESAEWNMLGVFPNFSKYEKLIKIVLILIIGKIVEATCEEESANGWCMKYLKDFNLNLVLDGELVQELNIKVNKQELY